MENTLFEIRYGTHSENLNLSSVVRVTNMISMTVKRRFRFVHVYGTE